MVEAVGNRVVALRRVRFGPIELGELAEGGSRRLSEGEIARLWERWRFARRRRARRDVGVDQGAGPWGAVERLRARPQALA